MSDLDDIPPGVPEDEFLAAEYALGALDHAERAQLAARAAWDAGLAARIAEWEALLAPMAVDVAEAPPPPSARGRLMRELFGEEEAETPVPTAKREEALPRHAKIRRELAGWRALAVAAMAAFGVMIAEPDILRFGAAPGPEYVAVIASEDGELSFVVHLDADGGRMLARRVAGAEAGDGSVYQLWMVADEGPVSLGLLDADGELHGPEGPTFEGALPEGAALAISREPAGGSPTGTPTGPVVAHGAPVSF